MSIGEIAIGEANTEPGEDAEEDGEIYEVEKILADRIINGQEQYLIKWKNYPHTDNTWEQEKDLNCPEILQEYLKNRAELRKIREFAPENCTTPKSIVDAFRSNKKLFYVVRYENDNKNHTMEAKDLHKIDIIKCIDFLEQKRTFKQKSRSS
ncbi:Chromobox protein 3 [Tritrichomonas foetus]|uniref:Chromobox protein 3 n=1 Tax=Tritrichomonas foetus TaxID=1144522 RepID=A0A1J4L0U0_9EUKA|nr:Chromobox protein 3 [Tritrichomonas foetus]|eukprot:OHT15493.1 Chromobox protein 3 [Tritrichomonas foetus]